MTSPASAVFADSLRQLSEIKDLYILPSDDFAGEALIPCLRIASAYRCMAGFFDSRAFATLAPGLAEFMAHETQPIQLIISPNVDPQDYEAIQEGLRTPAAVLESQLRALVGEVVLSETSLARYTLKCLAYLLASGRIEIKVGLVRRGLFHMKVWLFSDRVDWMVFDGSTNLTQPALGRNVEQVRVSRAWEDERQAKIVEKFQSTFQSIWDGAWPDVITVPLPEAVAKDILVHVPPAPPTPDEYWQACDAERRKEPGRPAFYVPAGLNYATGDYAHQGNAIEAWESTDRRGILEMATGAGKTKTALVASQRLWEQRKRLLVVIAVPVRPLIHQWAREAREFGLDPLIPGERGSRGKLVATEESARRLTVGASDIECLVVTHDLLCDPEFQAVLATCDADSLLIADEVHNLGRDTFVVHPPESFEHRLGLSATPIRQYDEEGTDALLAYFGKIVFSFTLEDAIGKCLVRYDYFVRPVHLTTPELEEWLELTARLRKRGWMSMSAEGRRRPDRQTTILLNRRRDILEGASNKIDALREELQRFNVRDLRHTLIYASDKQPEQLQEVNELLRQLGIRFHQVTADETAQNGLTPNLIEAFRRGDLQVLTAKRVLDEGVDIPEVCRAYILASTTVERQWVQRRGRVLRQCPTLNKQRATIYDFLVLPPPHAAAPDDDIRGILRGELNRIAEFASLAENVASAEGARSTVHPIIMEYF